MMNHTNAKLCVLILIFSSCLKDNSTHKKIPNDWLTEPKVTSTNQLDTHTDRKILLNPPVAKLFCGLPDVPAVSIPKINVNYSIEIIFAKVEQYTGTPVKPKAIKWTVNGETILQLTDHLKLPYQIGNYDFEARVTLTNETQLLYEFGLEVTHDMNTGIEGFINYLSCPGCLTITPCCYHHTALFVCPVF